MSLDDGISVIIPVYNKKDTIQRCLNSVLNQTFQAFEIILIDDGSTDEPDYDLDLFKTPKIQLIRQNNRGVSAARNAGILRSKFSTISFLDADDAWEPEYLMKISELQLRFPDCDIFATAFTVHAEDATKKHSLFSNSEDTKIDDVFKKIDYKCFPFSTPSVSFTKKALLSIGMYNESQRQFEDREVFFKCFLNFKLAYSGVYLVNVHSDAKQRLRNDNKKSKIVFENIGLVSIAENSTMMNMTKNQRRYLFLACYSIGKKAIAQGDVACFKRVRAILHKLNVCLVKTLYYDVSCIIGTHG